MFAVSKHNLKSLPHDPDIGAVLADLSCCCRRKMSDQGIVRSTE